RPGQDPVALEQPDPETALPVEEESLPAPATLSDVINFTEYEIVDEGKIEEDLSLATFLEPYSISVGIVDQLTQQAETFDIFDLEEGHNYVLLGTKERSNKLRYLIYTPNIYQHLVFKLHTPAKVQLIKRAVKHELRESSAIIDTSLLQAFEENKIPFSVLSQMEEAMAWTLDFYQLERNDRFKVIYEVTVSDGQEEEVGQVQAVYFETGKKEYYAFYFDELAEKGYYNQDGRPMKSTFLNSPIKYGRISSPYNARGRLHPIKGVTIPHLGTDYAAKEGTEIRSVADGVVSIAAFKANNGNYVKIRHNETYESQYLHMKGFRTGIREGTRVKQGEVIGYVGMTGLATGPHVCFRFWKNKKQVNHLEENLVQPVRFNREQQERFFAHRDSLKSRIDEM
ncbi:MAG: peptidoglycan DD-metalloendopeptidase family protein, partial [Phaeodactylibacter sp.]|nr:peptidoglycan DD-metalloendopeptidase family protein [Phaeodactylibacter sp.]